ncbi:MAG: response regulator [Planctomycetaceae bacterium]
MMKILVVDDVGCVRHLVQHRLSDKGFVVTTAGSGSDALTMLRSDPSIQVVISDLVMPVMDGVDLFRAAQKVDRLNDQGAAPPPVFFLMTALRSSATIAKKDAARLTEAEALGVFEILQKPLDFDYLLGRLRDLQKQSGTPVKAGAPAKSAHSAKSALEPLALPEDPRSGDSTNEATLRETRTYLTSQLERIDSLLNGLEKSASR